MELSIFVSSVFQKPTFRFTLSSLCPAHVDCRLPSLNYIPWIILRCNRCKLRFVVLFFLRWSSWITFFFGIIQRSTYQTVGMAKKELFRGTWQLVVKSMKRGDCSEILHQLSMVRIYRHLQSFIHPNGGFLQDVLSINSIDSPFTRCIPCLRCYAIYRLIPGEFWESKRLVG